jgi:hypothetical protein
MRTALPSHFIPSTHGSAVLRAAGRYAHQDDPVATLTPEHPSDIASSALLDVLPHPALLLSPDGHVKHVNLAWREARERRLIGGRPRPGDDYLKACADSPRWPASGPALANGIRAVLAGERERFEVTFGEGCSAYVARGPADGSPEQVLVVQRQG